MITMAIQQDYAARVKGHYLSVSHLLHALHIVIFFDGNGTSFPDERTL